MTALMCTSESCTLRPGTRVRKVNRVCFKHRSHQIVALCWDDLRDIRVPQNQIGVWTHGDATLAWVQVEDLSSVGAGDGHKLIFVHFSSYLRTRGTTGRDDGLSRLCLCSLECACLLSGDYLDSRNHWLILFIQLKKVLCSSLWLNVSSYYLQTSISASPHICPRWWTSSPQCHWFLQGWGWSRLYPRLSGRC